MFILTALFSLLVAVSAYRRRELKSPGRRRQREGQKGMGFGLVSA